MAENNESIVERRLRYIERQRQLGHGVDVHFEGLQPMGSGPRNRHGMPQVPVEQRVVTNWPVLDLGDHPDIRRQDWRLELAGLVENPVTLTWSEFMALPQVEDVSDFHCVTTWSRLENHWRGVRFKTLAELAVPREDVTHVLCTGYDRDVGSQEPYTTNLPLARAVEEDVLLVHTWEGKPLPREHGGPLRMITPKLYAWKGTKWIRRIEFLDRNRRGFWERRGYSDTAEPWFNDRYSRD
ncbi:MAG TPA: molybdopterin-dependent oxidoreductase [Thermoanaerobaculia bacterium]|nr:molybdopterin-dependent oxidoreductase [Thermoanaerobaculia bacterium]